MLAAGLVRSFRRRAFFPKKEWYQRPSRTLPLALASLALGYQYYLWTKRQPQTDSAISELSLRFKSEPQKVVTASEVLERYAQNGSHSGRVPRAVLFPTTHEDTEQMVKMCYRYKVPFLPYGRGNSVRGGNVLSKSGVVLNLSQLKRVKVEPGNLSCVAEAGATISELNAQLKPLGLWIPFEEYTDWTVGGLAAINAASQYSQYERFGGHVMSLHVVLPSGKSVKTKNRNQYGRAGYNLNEVFVGSEGTLGVITKLALKLQKRPTKIAYRAKLGISLQEATQEAQRMHQSGSLAEEIELLPNGTANLYISLEEAAGRALAGWVWSSPGKMHNLPAAHSAFASIGVPLPRLDQTLTDSLRILQQSALPYQLRCTPSRGEILVELPNPSQDPIFHDQAEQLLIMLADRAILKEGSCAVNHGVGADLMKLLESDVGANSVALQRQLKSSFDPYGLCNPGKVLPGMETPGSFVGLLYMKMKQFWLE